MSTMLRTVVFTLLTIAWVAPVHAAKGDTTRLDVIVKDRFPGTPTTLTSTVYVPPAKSWARILLKVKLE